MIQLHDSVLLLSEFPCFSNGLRHVRNYAQKTLGTLVYSAIYDSFSWNASLGLG